MEIDELGSRELGEFFHASLGACDMEAVEALMSMTKHCNPQSLRFIPHRPLTPSSDYLEEDSAPGSSVLQESPPVSGPYRLGVEVQQLFCSSILENDIRHMFYRVLCLLPLAFTCIFYIFFSRFSV